MVIPFVGSAEGALLGFTTALSFYTGLLLSVVGARTVFAEEVLVEQSRLKESNVRIHFEGFAGEPRHILQHDRILYSFRDIRTPSKWRVTGYERGGHLQWIQPCESLHNYMPSVPLVI
jgi:hypothetical protein